jgi:hypothetical protein
MTQAQEDNFRLHFPEFTNDEAQRFASAHGEVVSLCGRRGAPNLFVMTLATNNQTWGPFPLNAFCASRLREVLQQQGY